MWNDTLLPQSPHPRSITTPTKSPISSTHTNPESLKRKRDVFEIIDVDALPTEKLPSKRLKSSDPDFATASVPKATQKSPSPKKGRPASSHWTAGLSKTDIQKLGRGVEASLQQPPPSSAVPLPNSSDVKPKTTSTTSATPVSYPPKRIALPTRLTPAERQAYSTSPERDQKATTKVAADGCTAHKAATKSNSSLDADSKPPKYDDADRPSITRTQESTNEVASLTKAAPINAPVDPSVITVGVASSVDREEQKNDRGRQSDIGPAQTTEPQVTMQPGETRHEAFLSEGETERLCTDDIPVDLPEYEMAEDFLRR